MFEIYERFFQLKIGENNGPGILIGLLNHEHAPTERLFEDISLHTPIKYTHSVHEGADGGTHYELVVPYRNMDVHVTFRAHSHGVVLTTPKSEPITLEEISDVKADEIYQQTRILKTTMVDSQVSALEDKLRRAMIEGTF